MTRTALRLGMILLGTLAILALAAPNALDWPLSIARWGAALYLLLMIELPAFSMHVVAAWIAGHTLFVGAGIVLTLSVVGGTRVNRSARSMPITGAEGMVGEVGDVVSPLQPGGTVFVHGEYWDAIARSSLPAGARIRVLRVVGMRLQVESADAARAGRSRWR